MSIYDSVKEQMGKGPGYPVRAAFTTYYGYAGGKAIGTFPTPVDAQKAGAKTTETVFDEAGFLAARTAYGEHQSRVHEEWLHRMRKMYPAVNDEVFALVQEDAWERGHASGYGEVEDRIEDGVAFAEKIIRAASEK